MVSYYSVHYAILIVPMNIMASLIAIDGVKVFGTIHRGELFTDLVINPTMTLLSTSASVLRVIQRLF